MRTYNSNKQKSKQLLAGIVMGMNVLNSMAPLAMTVQPTVQPMQTAELQPLEYTVLPNTLEYLDSLVFSKAYAQDYPGSATVDTMISGDTQTIKDTEGGTVITMSGGEQFVSGGGSGTVSTMSGGSQIISVGGSGTVNTMSGGSQIISVGGSGTVNTMMSGGSQIIGTSGSTGGSGTIVNMSGGIQTISGGNGTIVNMISPATQYISAGGTGTISTLKGSGKLYQIVHSGGSGIVLTLDGSDDRCRQSVQEGGSGTVITINGGVQVASGGHVTATTMNGGTQIVAYNSGSIGIISTMNSGLQTISGGNSGTIDIMNNGTQVIQKSSFGIINNFNGGIQIVSGGNSTNLVINSGATQQVSDLEFDPVKNTSGGTVSNVTVNSGGTQRIRMGYVRDTTINNGGYVDLTTPGADLDGNIYEDKAQLFGKTVNYGLLNQGNTKSGSTVEHLAGEGGTVFLGQGIYKDKDTKPHPITYSNTMNIGKLEGSQTFVINADLANDTADKIVIGTDAGGEHYIKVSKEATAAGQLGGLTGHSATVVENAGNANFSSVQSAIDGINVLPTISKDGSGNWNLVGYTVEGASNLAMTAASAANIAYASLLAADNNIQRRMGELRDNNNNAGVWVRTFGGEYEVQGSSIKHTAIQGGYDKVSKVHNGLSVTGITAEHLNGSAGYTNGDGKLTNTRLGIYHSWLGNSGHYYDLIVKTGKMYNEIGAYQDTKISGHYRTWNTSISAEYGYRKQLGNGYYITPQAELSFARINGAGYTADNGTAINQEAINSLLARLGISVGQQLDSGSYYLTASVLHEFSAKSKVVTGQGNFASTLEQDFKGTALELALGGNIKMGKNNNLYMEAARSFGGKAVNKWQLQAGFRASF